MSPVKPTRTRQWPVRLVIAIICVCLFALPYFTVTKNTLSSPENTMAFLEQSKTFDYSAQIIKNEVNTRLPQSVQQNLIARSLIGKIMDLIVTPQLLESVAQPLIKVQITLLNREGQNITLVNNKVELNVEPYKQNLSGYIASLGLPSGVQNTANDFSNSLPNSVTLIDGNKNPDSPVIKALEIRNWYQNAMKVAVALWWIIAISFIALIALLFRDLHKLFRVSAKTFGVLGIIVLLLSYVAPPSLNLLIPNNLTEASGPEISLLLGGINTHFFALTQTFAWWYLGLAIVFSLVAWYLGAFGLTFSPEEIKVYFNKQLKRIKK